MKKHTIVRLVDYKETGLFKYAGICMNYDVINNSYIFEHLIIPIEELFFCGQLVDHVFVDLSEIEIDTRKGSIDLLNNAF